jgi:hypothetical protein
VATLLVTEAAVDGSNLIQLFEVCLHVDCLSLQAILLLTGIGSPHDYCAVSVCVGVCRTGMGASPQRSLGRSCGLWARAPQVLEGHKQMEGLSGPLSWRC